MEKKKLLQPAKSKPKTQLYLASVFFKEKDNPNTASLVELYDTSLIIYKNTDSNELQYRLSFDFDLIFDILRGQNQDQLYKRTGPMFGIKFERHGQKYALFHSDENILKFWRDSLADRINQRGFHELMKPIKKIGKGNFASVYLATRIEDQLKFAIKAFSKEATYSEANGKESLVNEIQLMRRYNHKNLMKLYEIYESDNSIYISVQLLEGGQLYDKIKAKVKFSSDQIHTIMRGLLSGLQELHSKGIMHRDLKPENILFRKQGDYDCVICDFGLATLADEKQYLFVRCGTPGYVAPEVVNIKDMKAKYDPICDLFSIGVIFHILLTGKSPFSGKTYNEVLKQNRQCNINFETEQCRKLSAQSLDLLIRLLDKNPLTRISAAQALYHPFFENDFKLPQITKEETSPKMQAHKYPINKTSIMVNTPKCSIMANSPLMTSANPFRKNVQQPLKDDSCVKFKMREPIMTGKNQALDSYDNIDSPTLKKNMMKSVHKYKESRFGGPKKMEVQGQKENQYEG